MKSTDGSRTAPTASPPARDSSRQDSVDTARNALVGSGVHVMPAAVTASCLGLGQGAWGRFGSHWEALSPDGYASLGGARRLRRYGRFSLVPETGRMTPLPHASFVQPEDSNPLYLDVERTFERLTDSFVADPVFRAVLRLLGRVATALDAPAVWEVKVHPFRVVASEEADGLPTPEGRHRDGVTLVSSLLIGRRNAAGGESSVFDPDGRRLLTTVLREPGTLLLGDDRRTLHSVSPVRPVDRGRPAYRDVLVVTLAPG
jgi:hypothetical protein